MLVPVGYNTSLFASLINADQSNSSDNGVEGLTITPGYIKSSLSALRARRRGRRPA